MKFILTVILMSSLLPIAVKCQTAVKLDERNGFKTIKIGDDISKYASALTFWKEIPEDKIICYEYIPSDKTLYNVFDYKFSLLKLFFNSITKKLVGISIIRNLSAASNSNHYKQALDETTALISNFNLLFDNAGKKFANDNEGSVGAQWTGNKITMKLTASYQGLNKGSDLEILIFDKVFLKSKFESGF